jgi:hypothetical protein
VVRVSGEEMTLRTTAGAVTVVTGAGTPVSVGLATAASGALDPGERVTVAYPAGAAATPTALLVSVQAQTIQGVVTAASSGSLAVTTASGNVVHAVLAADAAITGGATSLAPGTPVTLTGSGTPGAGDFQVYAVAVPTTSGGSPLGWLRATVVSINGARALLRLHDGATVVTDVSADEFTVEAGSFSDSTIEMHADPLNYVRPGSSGLFQLVPDGENASQPGTILFTPVTVTGTIAALRSATQPSHGSGFVIKVGAARHLPAGLRAGQRLDVFYFGQTSVDGQPMNSVTGPVGARVTCTGVMSSAGLDAVSIKQ